jgi:glutamine amidotransferase
LISIIDYGMGNLRSVQKALEFLDYQAVLTDDVEVIRNSKGIILPGVGAFPDAMENLQKKGIDVELLKAAEAGKPIMGICLGMQLLFETGYEVRECKGLGLIKGSIKRLQGQVKIPHMGWNNLIMNNECKILDGVEEGTYVYFVHSFFADVKEKEDLNASTYYGGNVPAVVSKGNIFGLQFHPEKSGAAGIRMLKNFGELVY